MPDIVVPLRHANFPLLAEELDRDHSSLVEAATWDVSGESIRVAVADHASSEELLEIQDIILNHDPSKFTDREKAATVRDKLPLFTLALTDSDAWADSQVDTDFKRLMTRAFVELRMMVTGE